MRKLLAASAVVLALGGIATSAHAAKTAQTGNDYVTQCQSREVSDVLMCLTYARGVADGLTMWEFTQPETACACIPAKLTSSQLKDVAETYIRDNPKDRHLAAGSLLAGAFVHNWPCEKRGGNVN